MPTLRGRKRLREVEDAVKMAIAKSDEDFIREYLVKPSGGGLSSWSTAWKHPRTETVYTLSLSQSSKTSEADLEACFYLVEETSREDYQASSRGWNPKAKREEMRDPDLRYILVKDPAGRVCGYTSLMPTMEEGQPVIYCYEIHLKPELRRTGLAALLMGFLETVAINIDVMDKVMLTVFTCNTGAVDFYRRCGFERDDISPQPRKLRNGVVKEPDYSIMSKSVGHTPLISNRDRQNSVSKDEEQEDMMVRSAKIARLDPSEVST